MNQRTLWQASLAGLAALLAISVMGGCEPAPGLSSQPPRPNAQEQVARLRSQLAGIRIGYPVQTLQEEMGLPDPQSVQAPDTPKGNYRLRYFFRGTVIEFEATGAADAKFLSALSFAGKVVVMTEKTYWASLAGAAARKNVDATMVP